MPVEEVYSFSIDASSGPMLVYVNSDKDTVTLVDVVAPSTRRERGILRALITEALALLGEAEKADNGF